MSPITDKQFVEIEALSHRLYFSSLDTKIKEITQKIKERGDLSYVSVKEQLTQLRELSGFPLGQFLIIHQGLNGFWTDYVLMHPRKGRLTGLTPEGKHFSKLESFLLNEAPTVLATQERFTLFQQELQKRCCEGVSMVSVPCGLMSDLLTLDFSQIKGYNLVGVDIDPEALNMARDKIPTTEMHERVCFLETDAWHFTLKEPADVITSNGLNIYEKSDDRVVELYKQFFLNLKPGGVLVTSFLTPPPGIVEDSEWDTSSIDSKNAQLQKVIFADILNASWRAFRSSKETIEQLSRAGFVDIQIIPDKARIFPTVVAHRPKKYG